MERGEGERMSTSQQINTHGLPFVKIPGGRDYYNHKFQRNSSQDACMSGERGLNRI